MMISRWRLETARDSLWELLTNPTEWPGWWPHLHSVSRLAGGDAEGIGARHAFVWRSGLGYHLRFAMTTTHTVHGRELEATANGDLHGSGLWIIEDDAPGALRLTYRWDVELSKPWLRRLAPLLQRMFVWRHFVVMAGGARGMAGRLGCRLSQVEEWWTISRLADGLEAT